MTRFLLEGEQSQRMWFRKLSPEDFDSWLPFYHDPASTEFWEGLAEDPRVACQEQFERVFERYEKGLGGMNALIAKDSSELIGICGLLVQNVDDIEELEIGYSLLPAFRGRGYATEAARKCRDFAFEKGFSNSLISIIHVDNIPSQKVAVANGMQLDKTTVYKNNPVHIFRISH
ncbi:GNAT family N-acetyltransferase [Poritiphilus flavus]|uniref:GNAT family N-acetyltransferase n=1 Tax=Poritiphilus flavus TaxID=2697053 RepID=A0A6L9E8N5_9FLAO|nr:GNAT family N-acetyltransferase [Poritiphilus flavus]NAS11086.1 GNAT family N-acetyltransferase [Poritiphilus flavus]